MKGRLAGTLLIACVVIFICAFFLSAAPPVMTPEPGILSGVFIVNSSQQAASTDRFSIYFEKIDGGYQLYANNDYYCPMNYSIAFDKLLNLTASLPLPATGVVPARSLRIPLFTLLIADISEAYSFSFKYIYGKGDPAATNPDEAYLYYLPYFNGQKHKLLQGYHGVYTHYGINEYGLDFDFSMGTQVFSARDGIVVAVKQDSNTGGPSESYAAYGNYVSVMHDDGTFGEYYHLRLNGAAVTEGQHVSKGELLGYSGNTGWTSGPHLHFMVTRATETGDVSIPTHFYGKNGESIDLQEGMWYYSFYENGAPFKEIYGATLTDADYENIFTAVAPTNVLSVVYDKVDDTYVLFVSNGNNYALNIQISFTLVNMTCSKQSPITLKVQALQKAYLCIIRPADPKKQYSYGYKYSYWK